MKEPQAKYFLEMTRDLPEQDLEEVHSALKAAFPNQEEERAVDLDLLSSDEYVFLWRDLIGLDSLVAYIKGRAELDASLKVKLLKELFLVWLKMRSIRVKISESEAKVLRAIRSGQNRRDELAKHTNLSEAEIKSALLKLKSTKYLNTTPLVEEVGDTLSTRF